MEGQIDLGREKQTDRRTDRHGLTRTDTDRHGPAQTNTDQHGPTQTNMEQLGPTRTNKRTNGLTDGPMDTQNVRSIPSQLSYTVNGL